MDFSELMLAEKIGKVLALAVSQKKYNRYELIKKWLASETYDETIHFSVHLCSQSKLYILNSFEDEISPDLPSIDEDSPLYEDDLFWFGYIVAYWFFLDKISGTDILRQIDVGKMLDEYDVLHTLSPKHAIELIKEDDSL